MSAARDRRSSSLSTVALGLRSMRSFRGALVALGIVVLLATAGVVAWPSITASLVSSDARYQLSAQPSAATSLGGTLSVQTYIGGPSDAGGLWDSVPAALTKGRRNMQPALRAVTEPGRFVGRSDGVSRGSTAPPGIAVVPVASDPPRSALGISVEGDPELRSDARLVDGRWPKGGVDDGETEVVMSAKAARALKWKLGTTRTLNLDIDPVAESRLRFPGDTEGKPRLNLRLVGTVAPHDASSDFWTLDPVRADLGRGVSSDPNLKTPLYHGLVWMDADAWPKTAVALGSPYLSTWYGIDDGAVAVPALRDISAAATSFVATPIPVGSENTGQDLRLSTQLPDIINEILSRIASVPTLLAIVAIGPLGAAIAVLFSGARLMASRRARSYELMRARGGSEWRVRGGAALEAAAFTVPAAIVGGVAASLVTGAGASAAWLIAACALLPPIAIAATASSPTIGRGRRRPVLSWTVELLVILLAAAACIVLAQRGAQAVANPLSIDPLLVATPLLLVFALCIVVLRLYPPLLHGIGRLALAARGAVGPVGWATAARGGAGRLWPLFAMLTGVAVAVFAGNTLTVVLTGGHEDALRRVSADITVQADLSEAQLKQLGELPDVAAVAPVRLVGYADASTGQTVATYLVDAGEVMRAQSDVPADSKLFPVGSSGIGGATVLGGLPTSTRPDSFAFNDGRDRMPVRVVDHAKTSAAPFLTDPSWALIDQRTAPASVRAASTPTAALIDVRPGADVAAVADQVNPIVGADAVVDSTSAAQDRQEQGPLLPGIQKLMLAGSLLAVIMAVAALLLTLAMGRRARVRLLSVLRTLGFDRGQSAALVAWEVTPLALTAIVVGVLTGLGLSWLVLDAVDLRPITGALERADFAVSWQAVAVVVGVFALGTAIAVGSAVVAARRADPARSLRAEEET
ncbi:FtsX-like permease family protein [Humibacter soli]